MWNKLRARHFTLIVLAVIVILETSAIAIDRFLSKPESTAFQVASPFKNNVFLKTFKVAEAKSRPIPRNLSKFSGVIVQSQTLSIAAPTSKFGEKSFTEKLINKKIVRKVEAKNQILKQPIVPDRWVNYSVKKGDSLAAVAGMFSTSKEDLESSNNLSSQGLKAGQNLKVPVSESKLVYVVRKGDTLTRISGRFGAKISEIKSENELKSDNITLGQKITIPMLVHGKTIALPKAPEISPKPQEKVVVERKIEAPRPVPAMKTGEVLIAAAVERNKAAVKPAAIKPIVEEGNKTLKVVKVTSQKASPAPVAVKKLPAQAKEDDATEASAMIRMVCHTVQKGDSLSELARKYRTSISNILSHNQALSSNIKVGQKIQIPVSKKYFRVLQVKSRRSPISTKFGMPVRGRMSDRFGWRTHPIYRKRMFHAGMDVAAPKGTPIFAAQKGTVIYSGWLSGYGKVIVLKHARGITTRYGHCSKLGVKKGEVVRQGQLIGKVGSTGTATGNHLHFEVRSKGKPVNPMTYL